MEEKNRVKIKCGIILTSPYEEHEKNTSLNSIMVLICNKFFLTE